MNEQDTQTLWFQRLVASSITSAGGDQKLADMTGIARTTLQRWAKGENKNLSLEKAAMFITALGGDMKRALPDWEAELTPPAVKVIGQVQAGAFSAVGDAFDEIHLDLSAWRNSPYASLTFGETTLVQIVGDSMEPRYSPGEFLVCRAPVDPAKLNDNTPCIFSSPRGSTFKILRKSREGIIVGQPLNPHHEIIIFNDRDVTVQLVVLGSVDLGFTKAIALKKRSKG